MPKVRISQITIESSPEDGQKVATPDSPAAKLDIAEVKVDQGITASRVEEELGRGANLSIITLINHIIENAYQLRASDIHIDPATETVRVRLRIDGVLQEAHVLPKTIHAEVVSRIKILAGMRTDEHQAAQDGRFHVALPSTGGIDVRVSITPTY